MRGLFAGGRGRWLAAAASITVSVAMFHAQSKDSAVTPAAAPSGEAPAVAGPPSAAASPAAELLVASAPLAAADYDLTLPPGRAP